MIDQILAALSPTSLILAVSTGMVAGAYLDTFHPVVPDRGLLRLAIEQGWYFGLLTSLLYVGRVFAALASGAPDVGRIIGGWILVLLFSVCLAAGAYLTGRMRHRRAR